MSREHYVMKLTLKSAKNTEGELVYLFVDQFKALFPQADGTCVIVTNTDLEYHVTQSAKTIIEKAASYSVIGEIA